MRRLSLLGVATAASIGLVACSGDALTTLSPNSSAASTTSTVTSVTIAGATTAQIPVGQTLTLVATAADATGATVPSTFLWVSSDTTVATVASGVVKAKKIGTTRVYAGVGSAADRVDVTVVASAPLTPAVTKVTTTLAASSIAVGATTQATAVAYDTTNKVVTGKTFTWTSASNSIATVSATGLVTAVGAGTTTITATSGTVKGIASLTVTSSTSGSTTTPLPPVTSLSGEVIATLPQTYVNTSMPAAPAAGGKILSVTSAATFTSALAAANYGDVIEIANGVTITGNFVLPLKGANNGQWITIRPANMAGMPAPGARMTPTIAHTVQLPIILSNNNSGAIVTAPSAHHYRIIGLEVSQGPNVASNTGLVRLGEDGSHPQTTLAQVPHDLVLDRMYIHGIPTMATRRCVGLNAAMAAVIDSHLSDCHDTGYDAQAILGWNGPGPFKIVNNYLEASGENIMFGGVDPSIPNLTPSDIEVRHNHFFKPASYKTDPHNWLVKNLFELKHAQRVLVEGNLFENNWQAAQSGAAIAMKTVNQNGSCTWCVTQDVTFRYNLIRNVGAGFTVSGSPDNAYADTPARRLTITNNILHSVNTSAFPGAGHGILINNDLTDVVFTHNTVVTPTSLAINFGGAPSHAVVHLSYRDNITGGGQYGIKGTGVTAGSPTLTAFAPGAIFGGNVIFQAIGGVGYPTTSYYPTSVGAVGLANAAAFDFHLLSSSPYSKKGLDGTDPGANVDAVMNATANVIVP